MVDISVPNGDELTPVEAAILQMDQEIRQGISLAQDIKRQAALLETAMKLMVYELQEISKHLKKKE